MKIDFAIKKGGRVPALEARLEDENGSIDLEGASVKLRMRRISDGTVKVDSAPAEILEADPTQIADGAPNVRYPWAEGDTDAPGIYEAEWLVIYGDGSTERFPANTRRPFVVVQVQGSI